MRSTLRGSNISFPFFLAYSWPTLSKKPGAASDTDYTVGWIASFLNPVIYSLRTFRLLAGRSAHEKLRTMAKTSVFAVARNF